MRVLVTGITGFIGQRLGERLVAEGHEIIAVMRDVERPLPFPAARVGWEARDLKNVDAVIHLAGEPIAGGRWSPARKKRILGSRVDAVGKLKGMVKKPKVFLSASGIGFYGNRGAEALTEASIRGSGFLADVCEAWEKAAREAGAARTVMLRTGMVLGPGGGALAKIEPIFRAGLGGRLGAGKQWVSWIHLEDIVDLYLFALRRDDVVGPVNAVAPFPVTNQEFTKALAKAVGRPALLPVPSFALRLILGEMSTLLLDSQKVIESVSKRRFEFRYPDLQSAFRQGR